MLTASFKVALLATASVIEARSILDLSHFHGDIHKRQNNDLTATVLAANAIQTGSFNDGSNEIGAAEKGQALSKTSKNNFINNCAGKTLTNGLQIVGGSCNGIPMGDIPAKTNMVSSIITFPLHGSNNIQSDTTFNITVQMANLVAGSFTNADATYYAAPQQLSGGKVVGHTHVTVQDMGKTLNPKTALDPTQFAFFKGINDAGNGNGLLQATVTGGLPAGNYRVCTMASASNHQGVLMPVAQRGTADDCTKFTVVGSGTTENAAANDGKGGQAAAAAAQSAVDNPGPTKAANGKATSTSATKASGSAKAVDNGNNGKASASSSASTSSAAGKNGKGASSSAPESSAATKAGNNGKATSSEASTSSAAGKNGKGASSSAPEASTSSAAGKNGKGASSSAPVSSAATKAGKDGKTESSVAAKATSSVLKVAPFSNSSFVASSAQANEGKGGKGAQVTTASEASSASVTLPSVGSAATTSKKISGGGKAVNSQASSGTIVQKVTIIETFFVFVKSLGGLPPSVSKQGEQFFCKGELFADISAAASAACGHQFNACVSFSGPNFSFEECTSQQSECGASASVAVEPPAPQTVTATVTVPVTATVTGTVISETTLSVSASGDSVAAVQTQAAVASSESTSPAKSSAVVAKAQTTAPALVSSAAESKPACSVVTGTVTVDAPEITKAAAPFSNSTSNATPASSAGSAAATGSVSTSSAAIGGIEAPKIINSGDSTRPFSVNGNTFVNKSAAVQRSCDVQFNACANAVNGGKLSGVTLADCSAQQGKCGAQ